MSNKPLFSFEDDDEEINARIKNPSKHSARTISKKTGSSLPSKQGKESLSKLELIEQQLDILAQIFRYYPNSHIETLRERFLELDGKRKTLIEK